MSLLTFNEIKTMKNLIGTYSQCFVCLQHKESFAINFIHVAY